MSRILFLSMFIKFVALNSITASGQAKRKTLDYPRNVGISISKKTFDLSVKKMITKMETIKNVNTKDLIRIVRIENTINFDELIDNTRANGKFDSLFKAKDYEKKFIKKLHAKFGLGISYFSKQYKIYLGGIPDSNSMFKIYRN